MNFLAALICKLGSWRDRIETCWLVLCSNACIELRISVIKCHDILFKAAFKTILNVEAMQHWLLQLTVMRALEKLVYSLRNGIPGLRTWNPLQNLKWTDQLQLAKQMARLDELGRCEAPQGLDFANSMQPQRELDGGEVSREGSPETCLPPVLTSRPSDQTTMLSKHPWCCPQCS